MRWSRRIRNVDFGGRPVYLGAHSRRSEFEQSLLRMIPAILGQEEYKPLSEQMIIILFHSMHHHSQSRGWIATSICATPWEALPGFGCTVGVANPLIQAVTNTLQRPNQTECVMSKMTLSPPRARGTQVAVSLLLLFARVTEFPSH